MKIHSIFPDKWFAKLVMTTLKKESVDSEVTKEDLLSVKKLQGSNHFIKDITGIGYLTNLEYVNLSYNHIKTLPEEVRRLQHLRTLDLAHNHMGEMPEHLFTIKHLEN